VGFEMRLVDYVKVFGYFLLQLPCAHHTIANEGQSVPLFISEGDVGFDNFCGMHETDL
jgi:hypothetical protein